MKARSGEAVSNMISSVSVRGPKQSKIFSEWLENKVVFILGVLSWLHSGFSNHFQATFEREPHLRNSPSFTGPNYFELNYDATLVVFSFFDPQVSDLLKCFSAVLLCDRRCVAWLLSVKQQELLQNQMITGCHGFACIKGSRSCLVLLWYFLLFILNLVYYL